MASVQEQLDGLRESVSRVEGKLDVPDLLKNLKQQLKTSESGNVFPRTPPTAAGLALRQILSKELPKTYGYGQIRSFVLAMEPFGSDGAIIEAAVDKMYSQTVTELRSAPYPATYAHLVVRVDAMELITVYPQQFSYFMIINGFHGTVDFISKWLCTKAANSLRSANDPRRGGNRQA